MIDDILVRRTLAQRLRGLGAAEDELSFLLYAGETPDPADAGVIDFATAPTLVRVFEGEDSGTTDTNSYNLSQGNGNEHTGLNSAFGWGTVLPADFQVAKVTIGARINQADGSTYQLTKGIDGGANALVGPTLLLPGNTLAAVFDVDEVYSEGDSMNIWTIEGGATDCVGCVWGYWL